MNELNKSDSLSDAQLLKKFGIRNCCVKLKRLRSDECDAVIVKSSLKQDEKIKRACHTKRLLYYESTPNSTMVKEISIALSDNLEEKPSWMEGLIVVPMNVYEHLNRLHGSNPDIKKKTDMAEHKSTSQLSLNKRSSQLVKGVLNGKRRDLNRQNNHSKRNRQSTAGQAIQDKCFEIANLKTRRNMIKHRLISQIKTSQPRLINKSNRTDSKVLKRKSNIFRKEVKCHKRNVQAVNNSHCENKKHDDSVLRKKIGLKNCFVSIPLIIPEIPKLKTPPTFQIHYSHQFLEEIAQKACLSATNKVIDLDRLYAETNLGQFSSLKRKNFNRDIRKIVYLMSKQDSSIKQIQLISRIEEKLEAQREKEIMWYNKKTKCIIVDATRVVRRQIRKLLKNIKYPLVLIERNKEADLLAQKLVEQNKIAPEESQQSDCSNQFTTKTYPLVLVTQNKDADLLAQKLVEQNKIAPEKSQQSDCSNYKEHDRELSEMSKYPLGKDKKLQDLNDDGKEKQPLISNNQQNFDDASTFTSSKACEGLECQNSLDLNPTLELYENGDKGKHPLISDIDIETKKGQNFYDASVFASSKGCEDLEYHNSLDFSVILELDQQFDDCEGRLPYAGLQYNIPLVEPTNKLQQQFCETLHPAKLEEVMPYSQWPDTMLNLVEKPFENDCVSAEINCAPFQLINGDEHIDTTNVLKEVIYEDFSDCNLPSLDRESLPNLEHFDDASKNKNLDASNECNPPILIRENPLSMKHIDDVCEDKKLCEAIEEFFSINDDDDEKNRDSYSEDLFDTNPHM